MCGFMYLSDPNRMMKGEEAGEFTVQKGLQRESG